MIIFTLDVNPSKYIPLLPAILCICLFSGCSQKFFDEDFGAAHRRAFAAQVINPNAPDDPRPADALPGNIAVKIYRRSYQGMIIQEDQKDSGYPLEALGNR